MVSSAVLEREPITALDDDRQALAEAGQLLEDIRADNRQLRRPKLCGPGGEEVELPDALFRVMRQAVYHLLRGDSVTIAPLHQELTTQQAADLLNVSRPYLVQLLEDGKIPFTKTGAHRRVRLGDVLAFRKLRDTDRRASMQRLSSLSQELGLYED